MRPDFIVIGAMKAGTTSLFKYLRAHPRVFMPWRKELHFFSHDQNWNKGADWYEAQFAGASPGQRVGEASPSYSKRHLFPEACERLAKVVPGARIIYLVRDPVERIQSMYLDMLLYGGESRSISKAVMGDDDYFLTSCYGMQIEPYVERFGPERVLVVTSERLRANPEPVLGRVFSFINVAPTPSPTPIEVNLSENKRVPNRIGRMVRKVRPRERSAVTPNWRDRILTRASGHRAARLSSRVRDELESRFVSDLKRLEQLVEVDLSDWTWFQEAK